MITAKITVQDPKAGPCIEPDLKNNERSTVLVSTTTEHTTFEVNAKDATAFRAKMNSITQLLSVYEKSK